MEHENFVTEFQKENRKMLSEIWEDIENSEIKTALTERTPKSIALLKKEMDRKKPFESFKDTSQDSKKSELQILGELAKIFVTNLDSYREFDGELLQYLMHHTPDPELGTEISYIMYLFGCGEGVLEEIKETNSAEIQETLNEK